MSRKSYTTSATWEAQRNLNGMPNLMRSSFQQGSLSFLLNVHIFSAILLNVNFTSVSRFRYFWALLQSWVFLLWMGWLSFQCNLFVIDKVETLFCQMDEPKLYVFKCKIYMWVWVVCICMSVCFLQHLQGNEYFCLEDTYKVLLLFIHRVMSASLWTHGLQHARPFCPSPSPRVCPSSCSLHWWCRPAISSSDALFSFCPQSFPASGTFPVSHLFTSDDQNTGASASASILPVNIQGLSPLRSTGLISLLSKGLWGVFSGTTDERYQFFTIVPCYCPALRTICDYWEDHSPDYPDLC